MNKQVFIPSIFVEDLSVGATEAILDSDELCVEEYRSHSPYSFKSDSKLFKLLWLGVVNQFLGEAANAKEIVSVEPKLESVLYGDSYPDLRGQVAASYSIGYTVTYLASSINSKSNGRF